MVDIIREPISTTDTPLSPREIGLQQAANALQWGAVANGIFALLVVMVGVFAGAGGGDAFSPLAGLLIGGYGGAADAGLLVVIMLTLANVSALLVLMVGTLAQEFWTPLAVIGFIAGNIGLILWLGFLPALLAIGFAALAGVYILRDAGAYRINPLMLKELRERMRGARAFVVMTVYLGLMSGFAVLLYLITTSAGPTTNASVVGELGRNLFRGVVALELLLIVFITPAFTSGAVSNERERKTYDLLQITLLPYQSFVIGKLQSALGYIFLLLLAAIPLQSIAFLFGGVSQEELIIAFIVMTVCAVLLGTIGMYFSTVLERTLTATVRAYVVIFGFTIGIPAAVGIGLNIFQSVFSTTVNSSHFIQATIAYTRALMESLNPVTALLRTQDLLINNQGAGFYTQSLFDGRTVTEIPIPSPWLSLTILYLVISAVMIVLAVRGLRRSDA